MLHVIGAGFGRTGTHSLGMALEILGYGPCYNILEVSKNIGHTKIWNRALDGHRVDWDALFSTYQSAVEWPTVAFLSEIAGHFEEAKVILTWRDPQSWYESASKTIFEGLEMSEHNPDLFKRERSRMARRLILERTFSGRYWEKEYAQDVYWRHNRDVMEMFPPERLLRYQVKEGWRPLCAFLGKPIPDQPFPKMNERAEFLASAPDWAKRKKSG